MKTAWKWIAGVVTGIVAALLLFGKRKPKKKVSGPPKSRTTKVVVEQINDETNIQGRFLNESELSKESKAVLELIKTNDDVEHLEEVMKKCEDKGDEYLAIECAAAIEELKIKQNTKDQLFNLWSEDELQMEEDIAS